LKKTTDKRAFEIELVLKKEKLRRRRKYFHCSVNSAKKMDVDVLYLLPPDNLRS